ncbi:replication initiation factor domain-containing protein [Luteimonas sp. 50]|uniref:Replication initiation factor domain-containing protein n=1 Tax=Cognatiluteimonas sedimenti TaxID=2927791 RepID=A0ABT0A4N9_9GAMM|nr:replication initiation factor domain-containing protein [Lysobacter sedimenti]MCJ0825947.1 replication initiation factor domain-containing protein [Lysobacter sedimenti]
MNEKQERRAAAESGQKAVGAAVAASAAGAQPSITAPANSIRPLRHGVDSLYLSFPGGIDPDLAVWLQECKLKAQSSNDHVMALGGIGMGDHQFTVLPRGRGRFAFVLEDNWFSIQLSNASAGVLPLALVQLRSEYLTAVGPDEAVATITKLVEGMGEVTGPPKISRIDLFADFCTDHDLASLPGSHWVKRSKKRSIHEESDQVTGISFGSGNEVSARLYDKTRELLKSGKDYMRPLWAMEGWDGAAQVWRMEFQIRREGLPAQMLGAAADVLACNGSLWRYLCDDWLRLAIPSGSDDTRSRWPTHPLWEDLSRVWDIDPEAPPLTRVPKSRLPSDDRLFRHGISGLSSFMAREGITALDEGLGEFLHAMEAYYDNPARQFPEGLEAYIRRKTKAKARRYNVRLDGHEQG